MSLLAPLFLLGLTGLTVPVLIHLTQRTKKEPVPFPSLMFLSRVPFKTTRRQQIRNWLLFLLRSAAIVILVIAFARPWLRGSAVTAAALERAREVVILVDRSYSMALGERWENALEAARDVVTELGPDDRASLVLFSDRAEIVHQPMDDPSAILPAVDRAQLSSETTRYGPALSLAERILEESELVRRECVLISDFQRVGWYSDEDVLMPEGVTLRAIDVGDGETANLAVVDVSLDRGHGGGLQQVTALARIGNFGDADVEGIEVSLEIDGQRIESTSADVAGNGVAAVRFEEFAPPRREVVGSVRLQANGLQLDDVYHFVLSPIQTVSVLILQHPNADSGESLFLERALGIGRTPPYRVARRRSSQLTAADLEGHDVVILNDAPFPRGTSGERLREFILSGGGLFIALGQRSRSGAWPEEFMGLLPGRVGHVVDRLDDRGATMSVTDFDHPLLELFSAPRSGDFSRTRFFRYRRLEEIGDADVLVRFDDGAVALAEKRAGEGRALVWTSGLANSWNDFPVQPVFLPFIHQLGRYLVRYEPDRLWFTAGEILDLTEYPKSITSLASASSDDGAADDRELVVESPSGNRRLVRLDSELRYVALDEQGVYKVRHLEDDGPHGVVAVNVNPAESDLSTIDPEELVSAVTVSGPGGRSADLSRSLSPSDIERRQGLWWYMLMAALVILVAETILSNRLPQRAR